MKPTQTQLIALEKDASYKEFLRMAVLTVAIYWKGQDGVNKTPAVEAQKWFTHRQTAETILQTPQNSIQVDYWASRSMTPLKDMEIPGITAQSTVAEIVAVLVAPIDVPPGNMNTLMGSLAETTYTEEAKKVVF